MKKVRVLFSAIAILFAVAAAVTTYSNPVALGYQQVIPPAGDPPGCEAVRQCNEMTGSRCTFAGVDLFKLNGTACDTPINHKP